MAGAINFAMTDIYGGVWGTTETTIPDDNDKSAIVDENSAKVVQQKSTTTGVTKTPIFAAIILICIIAFLMGVMK